MTISLNLHSTVTLGFLVVSERPLNQSACKDPGTIFEILAFMAEGERVRGLQQSGFRKINTTSVADYEVAQSPTRPETLCEYVCVCGKCGNVPGDACGHLQKSC